MGNIQECTVLRFNDIPNKHYQILRGNVQSQLHKLLTEAPKYTELNYRSTECGFRICSVLKDNKQILRTISLRDTFDSLAIFVKHRKLRVYIVIFIMSVL